MRSLLRGKDVPEIEGHGAGEVCQRLSVDFASTNIGAAAQMEEAAAHLRQFHERPVSQGCAPGIHPNGLRDNAESPLASIPDIDEALWAPVSSDREDRLAAKCLDGRQRGKRGIQSSDR